MTNPLQPLIDLYLKNNREKYPNIPDHCRPKHKYSDKKANGLTACIIDFLNFSGHQAERISSSGRVLDNRKQHTDVIGLTRTIGSTKWIPPNTTPGTADISSIIRTNSGNSVPVKIEVKIGKDKLSPAQIKYKESIERAGGKYFVAKSFSGFYSDYLELIN